MDISSRQIIAFSIIGGIVLLVVAVLLLTRGKRRADKLRRRGVKSYNRKRGYADTP